MKILPGKCESDGWRLADGRPVRGFQGPLSSSGYAWLEISYQGAQLHGREVESQRGYVGRENVGGGDVSPRDAYSAEVAKIGISATRALAEALSNQQEIEMHRVRQELSETQHTLSKLQMEAQTSTAQKKIEIMKETNKTPTEADTADINRPIEDFDGVDPGGGSGLGDLFRDIASGTGEGLRDGSAHGLSSAAAGKLARLAVRHGAPEGIAQSPWMLKFLAAITPVLILLAIHLLREQLPKRVLSLEAVAHRAVRGAASSYGSQAVNFVSEWLLSVYQDEGGEEIE